MGEEQTAPTEESAPAPAEAPVAPEESAHPVEELVEEAAAVVRRPFLHFLHSHSSYVEIPESRTQGPRLEQTIEE